MLYDVSTLYFETDAGDGFREPGFSKERRLEPQITIGLLTDAAGFPLMVEAFEGNKAETTTMLPVINAFMAAHQLAGRHRRRRCRDDLRGQPEGDRGRRAVVHPGRPHPRLPYVVREWRDEHPDEDDPGRAGPHPAVAGQADREAARDQVIYYQYRHDRARRTLRGIDEQVAKAEKAVDGQGAGQTEPVHPAHRRRQERQPDLEAKTRALAGWKGYADAAVMPRSVGSLLVTLGCGAGSSA